MVLVSGSFSYDIFICHSRLNEYVMSEWLFVKPSIFVYCSKPSIIASWPDRSIAKNEPSPPKQSIPYGIIPQYHYLEKKQIDIFNLLSTVMYRVYIYNTSIYRLWSHLLHGVECVFCWFFYLGFNIVHYCYSLIALCLQTLKKFLSITLNDRYFKQIGYKIKRL